MIDKKKVLSSITNETIIKLAVELGFSDYTVDNQNHLCMPTCSCHGGDSPNKLFYYDDREDDDRPWGKFHCYTCGDTYDAIEWVIRAKRQKGESITWGKALYYLAKYTGNLPQDSVVNLPMEEHSIIDDFVWINRIKKAKNRRTKAVPRLQEINENVLEMFCYFPHEEWINEYINISAWHRFGICYWGLTDQIVIPHFDQNEKLIGIRGRFMSKRDQEHGKYMPLIIEGVSYAHALGNNLYGLNVVIEHVKKCKKIMLVEAEKSCLQAYSYYGDNSFTVATCGSSITATQIKIILSLGVEEVIYGPDRDYHEADSWEAEAWKQKILKRLKPLVSYVKVSLIADNGDLLGYKDSPTDRGKVVLETLMNNKIEITMSDYRED